MYGTCPTVQGLERRIAMTQTTSTVKFASADPVKGRDKSPPDIKIGKNHYILMEYKYSINSSRNNVWNTLIRLEEIYHKTSPAHHFFRVRGGGPLAEKSVIDCEETVDGQHVKHVFQMDRFEENSCIVYSSKKTITTMPNGNVFNSETICCFYINDVDVLDLNKTDLYFAVLLVFPNPVIRFVASLLGTYGTWKPHIVEESLNLARIIESGPSH